MGAPLRVIVTRPRAQAEPLARRIADLGHQPVLCPLIEIEPLGDEPIDTASYDWLIVTSANGAHELARRGHSTLRSVAAIGPGTAGALAEHGIEPDLVPQTSTQEGLLAELPRLPGRVLLAAAEDARRLLVDELGADFLPLYRTVPTPPDRPPPGDLVVLASASAARVWAGLDSSIPAVSIGPETTRAANEGGLTVVVEADPHDLDGLVRAVAEAAVTLRACSSPS
jgi:uroporphyrinogen-III synthase